LEKHASEDFRYKKTLLARLAPFLRKEIAKKVAAEKQAAEKVAEKEAVENTVTRVIFIMSYFYF
jgi:hypothetical protein